MQNNQYNKMMTHIVGKNHFQTDYLTKSVLISKYLKNVLLNSHTKEATLMKWTHPEWIFSKKAHNT